MRCIYCLLEKQPAEFNDEHVFPLAIGGSFIIRRVCTLCNGRLGSEVDVALTNNPIVEMLRHTHRLSGNSGTVPNPLERGTLASDPQQQVQYRFNKDGTPKEVYLVQRQERKKLENGQTEVKMSGDQKDERKIFEDVNRMLKRNGQPEQTFEEFQRHTVKTSQMQPIQYQASYNPLELDRAIAKIAYELAFHWLGEEYLQDPQAARLKNYLTDYNKGWETRHAIEVRDVEAHSPVLKYWAEEMESHLAALIKSKEGIFIAVRIFNTFGLCVLVSYQPSEYRVKQKFLSNNFLTSDIRDSDFEEEIARLYREGKFKL